jgi:hypothetical protein
MNVKQLITDVGRRRVIAWERRTAASADRGPGVTLIYQAAVTAAKRKRKRHHWSTRNRVHPPGPNSVTSKDIIQRGELPNTIRIRDEEVAGHMSPRPHRRLKLRAYRCDFSATGAELT